MKSVYIKTFGCSANLAESEIMAGILAESGNSIASRETESDVILVNVCTVKGEKKALAEISRVSRDNPGKKIVVGGCVTKAMVPKIGQISPDTSIINTDNIKNVAQAVESPAYLEIMDRKKEIKVSLPKIRHKSIISIIPISQGCTSFCTYCSTKLVKGNIFSYPLEKILLEARQSVEEGCKEIWLTSQDNGDYGFEWDKKSHLPELINRIAEIPGDFFVRVGMTNPIGVMKCADELVEAFKSEKVYKFIHIPVQAGNNDVLRRMARRYKVEDYVELVEKFRKAIPDITLSTDIICGFPGETRGQFNDTLELVRQTRPDIVNIARFVARDGTSAFRMEGQVHGNEKKARTTELTRLFRRIARENNNRWIGWKGEILVDSIGKNNDLVGRNYAYRQIIIKKHDSFKMGSRIKVRIVGASTFYLIGEMA
ncbi:MAG: MiaB-like protein tRNA modifying enzyme [archaeon GW2011_AR3]|nr:MAG: MiaB-like protein tRNA modifying enzyme [archaeon GW2011_AR3]MBS3109697.1 tRNA (N(6)-L-threonylcarbamoyladenosine(37)-C(2))-methylthiotransferase [Candidatus Woesearchaeota archaeon]